MQSYLVPGTMTFDMDWFTKDAEGIVNNIAEVGFKPFTLLFLDRWEADAKAWESKALKNVNWDRVNQGLAAFGFGNDVKTQIIEYAVGQHSASTLREFNALNATSQQLRTIGALGESGSKYLKFAKGLGTAIGIVGVAEAGVSFYNDPTPGNFLKLSVNTALLVAKVNPMVAVGVGFLDITGTTDYIYKAIDQSLGY